VAPPETALVAEPADRREEIEQRAEDRVGLGDRKVVGVADR